VTARKLNWQQPPSAEQIREIVPQTEFDVVSLGVLQALNGADGFDAFDVRLQALDPGPKATIASAFWAVTRALHPQSQERRSRGVSRAWAGFYHLAHMK